VVALLRGKRGPVGDQALRVVLNAQKVGDLPEHDGVLDVSGQPLLAASP
jgi:hypothetical protein